MSSETTYDVRVKRFFPTVPDFARDEKGDIDWSSLSGPQKIEARQQLSRERMVAGAEMKLLHEQLKRCYYREGVNHFETCRPIAEELVKRISSPYHGMPKAPSTEW